MKSIKQTYSIKAPIEEVWKGLVKPSYIVGWGAGPAIMNDKVGTKFKLWGGDIHGENIKVRPLKRLEQEWYGGDWPKPSLVIITLHKTEDGTRLEIVHKNVPEAEVKDITVGWKDYYFGPMKEYLEDKSKK